MKQPSVRTKQDIETLVPDLMAVKFFKERQISRDIMKRVAKTATHAFF
jgi:hypothetical protein